MVNQVVIASTDSDLNILLGACIPCVIFLGALFRRKVMKMTGACRAEHSHQRQPDSQYRPNQN